MVARLVEQTNQVAGDYFLARVAGDRADLRFEMIGKAGRAGPAFVDPRQVVAAAG